MMHFMHGGTAIDTTGVNSIIAFTEEFLAKQLVIPDRCGTSAACRLLMRRGDRTFSLELVNRYR